MNHLLFVGSICLSIGSVFEIIPLKFVFVENLLYMPSIDFSIHFLYILFYNFIPDINFI